VVLLDPIDDALLGRVGPHHRQTATGRRALRANAEVDWSQPGPRPKTNKQGLVGSAKHHTVAYAQDGRGVQFTGCSKPVAKVLFGQAGWLTRIQHIDAGQSYDRLIFLKNNRLAWIVDLAAIREPEGD
jgi:hypothetical protein